MVKITKEKKMRIIQKDKAEGRLGSQEPKNEN